VIDEGIKVLKKSQN